MNISDAVEYSQCSQKTFDDLGFDLYGSLEPTQVTKLPMLSLQHSPKHFLVRLPEVQNYGCHITPSYTWHLRLAFFNTNQ